MYDEQSVRGIVLSGTLLGEFDKRLVVLTETMGKITVFANGARRQNSRFTAAAQSFVMGRFKLRQGRQAYTLTGAEIEQTFLELTQDMELYASASYCCELTEYFTRENVGGKDELNLLYVTFRALLDRKLPAEAIRGAFGIKLLDIEGEMPEVTEENLARYILSAPIGGTYSFRAKDEAIKEMIRLSKKEQKRVLDYPLRSEEILNSLDSFGKNG